MAQLTIQQAFEVAVRHQQAGRWREAEEIYRQILVHQPRQAEVLYMMGMLAYQVGRLEAAVDLLRQAVGARPGFTEALCNLGNALRDHGRLDEALAAYRQTTALNPNVPEAFYNMGNTLRDQGHVDEAVAAFRQTIVLNPNLPEAHNNLGNALRDRGLVDEAMGAYRRAIAVRPHYAEAWCNLGTVLNDKGLRDEAVAACRQAIAHKPEFPEAFYTLGNALVEQGLLDEAIAAFRRGVALNPNLPQIHTNLGNALRDRGLLEEAVVEFRRVIALNPPNQLADAYNNLGNTLCDLGKYEEAVGACRQALGLRPDFPGALTTLGVSLQYQGQLAEAEAAYRRAIAVEAGYPEAHKNLALLLLLRGDFGPGWKEYEWRWRCEHFKHARWNVEQALWDGSDLRGRTILLHAEQGFGDTIQFIRYLPLVAARAGGVIFECGPELRRLLQGAAGVTRWLAAGDPPPPYDVHCPLMSLPRALGTTAENIPGGGAYLRADAVGKEWWRKELAGDRQRLKVGLVWAGRPTNRNNLSRSITLQMLAPLGQVPGVSFYSLQKGEARAQARQPPAGMELIDRSAELRDFADTAALLANLDLVIAVDTAVVHLAGAMGKRVWMLLPFMPDWRWQLGREDSPWYPTVRLFRQTTNGEWQSVIQRVAAALRQWSRGSEP